LLWLKIGLPKPESKNQTPPIWGFLHWTERARIAIEISSISSLVVMGLFLWGLTLTLWTPANLSGEMPVWAVVLGVATYFAGWFRTSIKVSRKYVGGVCSGGWIGIAIRASLVLSIVCMLAIPSDGSPLAWGIALACLIGIGWIDRAGMAWLTRILGLSKPAPPELTKQMEQLAAELDLPKPSVWVVRSNHANAFALPTHGAVAFTSAIVDHLPTDQVVAIARHEFGHLAESPRSLRIRRLAFLVYSPLLLLRPIQDAVPFALLLAIAIVFILSRLHNNFSRLMEDEADRWGARAESSEHDENDATLTFAQALENLHRVNLSPAVLFKDNNRSTHPNLYDRVESLGVQPDYPRPLPPRRWTILPAIVTVIALVFLGSVVAVVICEDFIFNNFSAQ